VQQRQVVVHRAAERGGRGEAATDDLDDRQEVDGVLQAERVDSFERGEAGEVDVAAGGGEAA
jgi:hypothetical protein